MRVPKNASQKTRDVSGKWRPVFLDKQNERFITLDNFLKFPVAPPFS